MDKNIYWAVCIGNSIHYTHKKTNKVIIVEGDSPSKVDFTHYQHYNNEW